MGESVFRIRSHGSFEEVSRATNIQTTQFYEPLRSKPFRFWILGECCTNLLNLDRRNVANLENPPSLVAHTRDQFRQAIFRPVFGNCANGFASSRILQLQAD